MWLLTTWFLAACFLADCLAPHLLIVGVGQAVGAESTDLADALDREEPAPTKSDAQSSESAKAAGTYVDARIERMRLEARVAMLKEELARLPGVLDPGSPSGQFLALLEAGNAETGPVLASFLEQNAEPLVADLHAAVGERTEQISRLTASWREVRTSLYDCRFSLFEVEASRRVAGQVASLLSVDKRWFWFFGLVAIATLVGLVFHDRRHELRRMLNGGRARKMHLSKFLATASLVLTALTLATFFLGDWIYESLLAVGSGIEQSPRESIRAELAALERPMESLGAEYNRLEGQVQELPSGWRERLAAAFPAENRVPSQWEEFRARLRALVEANRLLERIPQSLEADRLELLALEGELAAQSKQAARYLALRQWLRGGLGVMLLGLAATGGFFYRHGVRARREITANTCPLCLGVDHLETLPDDARRGGISGNVVIARCKNVVSEEPYEECDYSLVDAYRGMTKVCFPTLGVPQAGKTHWLSMLYWELRRGNYPASVQFEKVKSRSSEDYDQILEEILSARIGTAATQRDRIPSPLVFNFRDRDRWGRSNVLVNMFDYSGEVTADMGVEDYRRRRALEADGFLFFLDPTYPSEPQAKALADFREDIRLVKGVRTGQRVRIPVALCVSKIDVLAGQSYALPDGGDAIARFYEELGAIDPTGEAMTTKVIEARSRLTAGLRDTIWPGWEIERQIHDLFGGRYQFFPLTPVGLDGRGETDLSLRTISPFGLLEPLLWLLEMSGHPVLE